MSSMVQSMCLAESEIEENKKKIIDDEERSCVICLKRRKRRMSEWTTSRGTRAMQMYPEMTRKIPCCSGWIHGSYLVEWADTTGELVLLFKCPHCRCISCDAQEIDEFVGQ